MMNLKPSYIHLSSEFTRQTALIGTILALNICIITWINTLPLMMAWGLSTLLSVLTTATATLFSQQLARFMMDFREVDEAETFSGLNLHQIVKELIDTDFKDKGFSRLPTICIADSPVTNAFATGPSINNSTVVVTTGLINLLYAAEKQEGQAEEWLKAILSHEIGHVTERHIMKRSALLVLISPLLAIPVTTLPLAALACSLQICALTTIFYYSRLCEYAADTAAVKVNRGEALAESLVLLQGHNGVCSLSSHTKSTDVFRGVPEPAPLQESLYSRIIGRLQRGIQSNATKTTAGRSQFFKRCQRACNRLDEDRSTAAALWHEVGKVASTHPATKDRTHAIEDATGVSYNLIPR